MQGRVSDYRIIIWMNFWSINSLRFRQKVSLRVTGASLLSSRMNVVMNHRNQLYTRIYGYSHQWFFLPPSPSSCFSSASTPSPCRIQNPQISTILVITPSFHMWWALQASLTVTLLTSLSTSMLIMESRPITLCWASTDCTKMVSGWIKISMLQGVLIVYVKFMKNRSMCSICWSVCASIPTSSILWRVGGDFSNSEVSRSFSNSDWYYLSSNMMVLLLGQPVSRWLPRDITVLHTSIVESYKSSHLSPSLPVQQMPNTSLTQSIIMTAYRLVSTRMSSPRITRQSKYLFMMSCLSILLCLQKENVLLVICYIVCFTSSIRYSVQPLRLISRDSRMYMQFANWDTVHSLNFYFSLSSLGRCLGSFVQPNKNRINYVVSYGLLLSRLVREQTASGISSIVQSRY